MYRNSTFCSTPFFWYNSSLVSVLISCLLWPLSWLYRATIALRYWCYQRGIFKTHTFPIPIIVVGNITVGGTGKTPLVIWLANFLKEHGYQVGIVSRGYGRKTGGMQVVVANSKTDLVGDEPLLIYERTQCPMVIAKDRVMAVKKLLEIASCDIVISDDGLQHYALGRDLEIALIDGTRNLGNGFCLPAGPLREPPHRLKKVDFVIKNIIDAPTVLHSSSSEEHTTKYTMQLIPECFCKVKSPHQKLTQSAFHHLKQSEIFAVAAIGNPHRFFQQLRNLDLDFQEYIFKDHYRYQFSDFAFITGDNNNNNDNKDNYSQSLIMTEKDAIKCRSFAKENWWYLRVNASPNEDFVDDLWRKLTLKIINKS